MGERLADLQRRFAAHIRDPAGQPPPADVEDRRMEIYRSLFFRNLDNLLSRNFPVLRTLYDAPGWAELVRDFYVLHRARTPLFPELPREFLQYLQEQRQGRPEDPPFMLELAHYEWVELALDLDETELDEVPADPGGDLLDGIPVFSPLAWPLSYRFPVHRLSKDYQPKAAPPEATHLLVYRDRGDRVRFMTLNPLTALLVQLLKEDRGLSGRDLLQELVATSRHPQPERALASGAQILEELRARDVILGSRPEAA